MRREAQQTQVCDLCWDRGVTEPSGWVRFYFKRQQAASDWQGTAGKEDMKECVIGVAAAQVSLTEANWNKAAALMRSDECAAAPTSVSFTLTKPACKTKTVIWATLRDEEESTQTCAVLRLITRQCNSCTVYRHLLICCFVLFPLNECQYEWAVIKEQKAPGAFLLCLNPIEKENVLKNMFIRLQGLCNISKRRLVRATSTKFTSVSSTCKNELI